MVQVLRINYRRVWNEPVRQLRRKWCAWYGYAVSAEAGNWSYAGIFHGQLSATASDNIGATNSRNTSEFSTCFYIDNLPVTFLDFKVQIVADGILVLWNTIAEVNNAFFEVQRSINGIHFEAIVVYTGAENSSSASNYRRGCIVLLQNKTNRLSEDLIQKIQIWNTAGQEILTLYGSGKMSKEIDISGLASGVCYLIVKTTHNSYYEKIFKE